MAGAALAGFDGGAVGFVLPAARAATGLDAQSASWLVSGYVLGMLAAIVAAGAASRRVGAAPLFKACLLVAACGAGLAVLAEGWSTLVAARVLQGIGQGPLLPLAATLIAQQGAAGHQGRAQGALSLAYGLAFMGATVGTPWLLQLGWRAGFVASVAVALLAWMATPPSTPSPPSPPSPPRQPAGGFQGPGRDAGAAAWRGLANRAMAAVVMVSLATGIGQAVLVWLPTLAMARLSLGSTAASALMLPLVAGGLAASVAVTAALDRLGARALLAAAAAATLAGLGLAVQATASTATLAAAAALLGAGVAALSGGPLRYAAVHAAPLAAQGLAQAAVALVTNAGLLAGSVMLGALSARGATEAQGVVAALQAAGAVVALLCVAIVGVPARSRPGAGGVRGEGVDRPDPGRGG